jgi:hypothetical protein
MSFFELALDMRFSARIVLRRAKHRYANIRKSDVMEHDDGPI